MNDNEDIGGRDTVQSQEPPEQGRPSRSVKVEHGEPVSEPGSRLVTESKIDEGGMGIVNRALDTNLLRRVAVKVLQPRKARDAEAQRRLSEEAQITAQLDHPNIVPVHELGVDDKGALYFTMKLVQGQTLSQILRSQDYAKRSHRDLVKLLGAFLKVCDALAFAHSRGVTHRDLKPQNIMVGEFGEVYLMDWGIARLKRTRPSARDQEMPEPHTGVEGTPCYMAPEQARGDNEAIDERTDVFSMGGILYEMLTQTPPYFGPNAASVIYKSFEAKIVPPQDLTHVDLPPKLCDITMKALSKDPADRHQSILELKEEIEDFLQSGWHFERRTIDAGAPIIVEGDTGHEAFVILRGRCVAYKTVDGERVPLREMAAGEVFGETAVFTDQVRTASVEAMEDTRVAVITRANFEEMGMGHFAGLFVRALAERFREKDARVTELEKKLQTP